MIELKGVNFSYDEGSFLLRDMSVKIEKGQLTAIMGLNGTGKTTLIRLMTGALRADSGSVQIQGQYLTALNSKERAQKIGFVPQEFSTEFPFTVREFIEMGRFAWIKGMSLGLNDFEVINKYVAYFSLEDFLDRNIQTLSGGEKQRVLLARVFIQETPIVILDEPLNHLDIKNKAFVLESLKALCEEEGKTIVAVLHDLESLRRYFDRVVFLKDGGVVLNDEVAKGLQPEIIQSVFEIVS